MYAFAFCNSQDLVASLVISSHLTDVLKIIYRPFGPPTKVNSKKKKRNSHFLMWGFEERKRENHCVNT